MTTEQKRERRRMLARLRYANNPEIKAKYQAKARARIPVKCEYEKQKRRKEAEEQGRVFRDPASFTPTEHKLIMEGYNTERVIASKHDRAWTKHVVMQRCAGALSAREQWRRRKDEPGYRQIKALRHRLWSFAKHGKRQHMKELIGCSVVVLREHLAKQFKRGMSWKNYGEWEIDHIVPCTAFNLMDKQEQMKCFHFSNLQPLWKHDNRRKSASINDIQQELLLRVA